MFYPLARSVLFSLDAEKAHDLTIGLFSRLGASPLLSVFAGAPVNKPVNVMGLEFPNPVGLAAGLDKDGQCIDAFGKLGFGFVEVGTVTPKPQPGNPKPRCFRLKKHHALINRFGFNNQGVDNLIENVKKSNFKGVLGINIGKNKTTPEEQALDDYLICLEKAYPYAGYIATNISSPNTPGLRNLQHGEHLDKLLGGLKQKQQELAEQHKRYVPIALKIAPDLDDDAIAAIADAVNKHQFDGLIATNTTLERSAVEGALHAEEQGGLSGPPVADKSTAVIRKFRQALDKSIPIIGVGGIDSLPKAQEKIDAGASLVQIYTGFIYEGPDLVREIAEGLKL